MDKTRRVAIASLIAAAALGQDSTQLPNPVTPPSSEEEKDDHRLPDGRSRDNAIAKREHEDALKDARQLVTLAEQIRDEVEKAGNYVVPVATLKKTEEVEKLARKIRSRLKS